MRRCSSGSGLGTALRHQLRSSKFTAPKSSNSTNGLLKEKIFEMDQTRRLFFGSTFRRAFCNGFNCSSHSVMETKGFFQEYNFHTQSRPNCVDANPTIAAVTEKDHVARFAAIVGDLPGMPLSVLQEHFAQKGAPDELIADLALSKYIENKKITLQSVLISFQSTFHKTELKKDPDDREKLPWALPIAEIECDRIARLVIEEPLIAFVEAFFFGEKGQVMGTSSHAAFYTDNKGVPLRAVIGRNVKGCKREAGRYALERSLFYIDKFFHTRNCRLFCSHKSAVKGVQERMKRLKAGEKVSDDRYTKIAKTLIENGSTIEFVAKKDNLIAAFLAHIIGKLGDQYLNGDPPPDEKNLLF